MKLLKGNNIELLKTLEPNSVDSVVTDPPYGLKFMGKKWDYQVPTIEFWKEVYRILKPGGHILSFGGTRTYHRMVVNLEDAGFEIRDCISWIYGSGFPKSLNIGKAVDKIQGNKREIVGNYISPSGKEIHNTKIGNQYDSEFKSGLGLDRNLSKGSSPYEGQGTALKPAQELICLARKPISEKTIAENVMKWGTGGLNIDGCRIEYKDDKDRSGWFKYGSQGSDGFVGQNNFSMRPCDASEIQKRCGEGRFPSNIIFDEEAAKLLDEQSGFTKTRKDNNYKHNNTDSDGDIFIKRGFYTPREDQGGASRYFKNIKGEPEEVEEQRSEPTRFLYIPKVSKSERNNGLDGFEEKNSQLNSGGIGRKISVDKRIESNGENSPSQKNFHPTVKPIKLISYLCRLITPLNGIVLDPFMGSGSTGISAKLEGFDFIGMELDEEYFKIAEARINNYKKST